MLGGKSIGGGGEVEGMVRDRIGVGGEPGEYCWVDATHRTGEDHNVLHRSRNYI